MKSDLIFISIILFFTLMGVVAGANALETARGTSTDRKKALSNAHIAAHFQCGRKGLWADLDKLRVVETESTQYTIAGGRKKITDYIVRVEFPCKSDYQRFPTEEK